MNVKYLNGGLGLVASGKRNIQSGNQYNKYFGPPKREDKYLSYAGSTGDTIEFMADIIKNTLADTKQIARVLKGKDLNSTLKNVFDFIFTHVQYKPDDPTTEELRRPVRVWADRQSGVDCDCYSIFIGSVLSNLNIPFALRMVKINGKSYFQHVYVVIPKTGRQADLEHQGRYFTVDPVLDTYNEEHPFTGKYDLFMQPIKYLNGVPSASLNGLQGDAIAKDLFYSEEAAETPEDVIFFDGLNYYERSNQLAGLSGLRGLNGLDGLGFLKKIWGAVKAVGKGIKKIGKKAIKKVVFKKDGTKRGVFKLFSKKNNVSQVSQEPQLTKLTPNGISTSVVQTPSKITPIGTPAGVTAPNGSVSAKDMVDIAKDMNQSLGVDSILNVVRSVLPDNAMVSQIIDAKAAANKGLSPYETRMMASDAAKAQESEITKNVMDQVYRMKQFEQPQQAGFAGMNVQSMLMIAAAIGLTAVVMNKRSA
jgi:hypothetical protein